MKRKQTLADLVAVGLASAPTRQTWFTVLPDDAQAEIENVRKRFQAGEYGPAKRTVVARFLHAECERQGWKTCDVQRLSQWLAKSP